ncbi:MAG: diacylglycerol kinase family protein [Pseudomonadales bacterium]
MKQAFSPKLRIKSIGHALAGVLELMQSQPNAQLHLLATVLVAIAGFVTGINRLEWLSLVIVIAMVWAAEAFNTALEVLCDKVEPEHSPAIKTVKDLAAAGVLLTAIGAAVVGALVFLPHWLG